MHYKSCEICGIKSGRNKTEKRLFMARFPLDEPRCKQWVKIVGKEDLAFVPIEKLHMLKHVCGKHFKATHFKKKKTQLKKTAVPSLCITRQPLTDDLLVDFPLHVAKQEDVLDINNGLNSRLFSEHNYSKVLVSVKKIPDSSAPSTNISETLSEENTSFLSASEPSTAVSRPEHDVTVASVKEQKPKTSAHSKLPHKPKLLKCIQIYKQENTFLNKNLIDMEKIESPVLKNIIESRLKDQNQKSHGKKWTKLKALLWLYI